MCVCVCVCVGRKGLRCHYINCLTAYIYVVYVCRCIHVGGVVWICFDTLTISILIS